MHAANSWKKNTQRTVECDLNENNLADSLMGSTLLKHSNYPQKFSHTHYTFFCLASEQMSSKLWQRLVAQNYLCGRFLVIGKFEISLHLKIHRFTAKLNLSFFRKICICSQRDQKWQKQCKSKSNSSNKKAS